MCFGPEFVCSVSLILIHPWRFYSYLYWRGRCRKLLCSILVNQTCFYLERTKMYKNNLWWWPFEEIDWIFRLWDLCLFIWELCLFIFLESNSSECSCFTFFFLQGFHYWKILSCLRFTNFLRYFPMFLTIENLRFLWYSEKKKYSFAIFLPNGFYVVINRRVSK